MSFKCLSDVFCTVLPRDKDSEPLTLLNFLYFWLCYTAIIAYTELK